MSPCIRAHDIRSLLLQMRCCNQPRAIESDILHASTICRCDVLHCTTDSYRSANESNLDQNPPTVLNEFSTEKPFRNRARCSASLLSDRESPESCGGVALRLRKVSVHDVWLWKACVGYSVHIRSWPCIAISLCELSDWCTSMCPSVKSRLSTIAACRCHFCVCLCGDLRVFLTVRFRRHLVCNLRM